MLKDLSKLVLCIFLIPGAALANPSVVDSTMMTTPIFTPGLIVDGNIRILGATTVGTGANTVVVNNGAVNAAAQIQGASVAATGDISSSAGNITAPAGSMAAQGTISGSGLVAGSSGITSQGNVLSLGTVQGSSLAGALAGAYVQGAVALATNANRAAGTSEICNNGVVEGTDAAGDFTCQNTIANSTNAADAITAQSAAELSGMLAASQVQGTVASAASVTGSVAASQIQGTVASAANAANLTGTINGSQVNGAVASAATAGTAGGLISYNGSNTVKLGWIGSALTLKIDGTDFGSSVPANITGSSGSTQYALASGYTGAYQSQSAAYSAAYQALNNYVIGTNGSNSLTPAEMTNATNALLTQASGPAGTYWTYTPPGGSGTGQTGNAYTGVISTPSSSGGNGGGDSGNGTTQ